MKKIILLISLLGSSLAAAHRVDGYANRMVDGFINGSGGNYAPASVSDSSTYINQDIADEAFKFCKKDGKKPVEVYDINVKFHSKYTPTERIQDVVNLESQSNPIWSFSARVACR